MWRLIAVFPQGYHLVSQGVCVYVTFDIHAIKTYDSDGLCPGKLYGD